MWERYEKTKFSKFFEKIPNSLINFLSIMSAVGALGAPIIGYFKIKRNILAGKIDDQYNVLLMVLLISVCCVCLIIILKMIKYKQLLQGARKRFSEGFYNLTHEFRNTYFEILRNYKSKELNVELLTKELQNFLETALNNLCTIYSELTKQEVCGCIKYIDGATENIDVRDATIKTLARSENTQHARKSCVRNRSVKIWENTDFRDILEPESPATGKAYFYQQSLIRYDEDMKKVGKEYRNTTQDWKDYYRSTIVIPIRIANEKLFFNDKTDSYNVLGFLCLDSMSENAFLDSEEKYNVYLAKAFADEIYTILNQYKYYLRKMTDKENEQ